MEDNNYTNCEKCGQIILKGDVRHVNGEDLCEYCYDSALEDGYEGDY